MELWAARMVFIPLMPLWVDSWLIPIPKIPKVGFGSNIKGEISDLQYQSNDSLAASSLLPEHNLIQWFLKARKSPTISWVWKTFWLSTRPHHGEFGWTRMASKNAEVSEGLIGVEDWTSLRVWIKISQWLNQSMHKISWSNVYCDKQKSMYLMNIMFVFWWFPVLLFPFLSSSKTLFFPISFVRAFADNFAGAGPLHCPAMLELPNSRGACHIPTWC